MLLSVLLAWAATRVVVSAQSFESVCAISWTAFAPSTSDQMTTITSSTTPSSAQVFWINNAPNVVPPFSADSAAVRFSTTKTLTGISTGGAYFFANQPETILGFQGTSAYSDAALFVKCTVPKPTMTFYLTTTLYALDDQMATGSIQAEYWDGSTYQVVPNSKHSTTSSTVNANAMFVPKPLTRAVFSPPTPVSTLILKFPVAVSGSGPRDIFGVGAITVETAVATTALPTPLPTPLPPGQMPAPTTPAPPTTSGATTTSGAPETSAAETGAVETSDTTVFIPSSPAPGSNNMLPIYIGAGAAGAAVLICALVVGIFVCRRRARNARGDDDGNDIYARTDSPYDSPYKGIQSQNGSATQMTQFSAQSERDATNELVSLRRDANTIETDELELLDLLGTGSFGTVHRARWNGRIVAVKTLKGEEVTKQQEIELISEAKLMARMRPHTNVLLLIGVVETPHLALVSELCANGSLHHALQKCAAASADPSLQPPLNEMDMLRILAGTAAGMAHLHREKVIHRDLAARNILLTGSNEPKVSDFGMSRAVAEDTGYTKSQSGPLKWMAPESITDRKFGPKSDVWAFGVVIFEVLTCCREPYEGLAALQVATRVANGALRLAAPDEAHPILRSIVQQCTEYNAKDRPTFEQLIPQLAKLKSLFA